MVRFSANVDTSVTSVSSRRTAIEQTMAQIPTASGIAAASSPPNTQTSTGKLKGIAIASISSRSCSDCLLIST